MALPLGPDYIEGLNREWETMAAAGTWWTGAERIEIAEVARAARHGDATPAVDLPEPAVEAASRLSARPHVDTEWVDGLTARGLTREQYVEILGIAGRLAAVDSFTFGIGTAKPQPLLSPRQGEPTREPNPAAAMNGAVAPTEGPPGAPSALSAVPAEVDAMFALHGVLYLSLAEMADLEIVKDLSRAQMELIAARTSLLNDCFY